MMTDAGTKSAGAEGAADVGVVTGAEFKSTEAADLHGSIRRQVGDEHVGALCRWNCGRLTHGRIPRGMPSLAARG